MSLKNLFLLLLLCGISSCNTGDYKPSEISGERIPVREETAGDTAIENFVRPYSENIEKTLDSVLAYNPFDLNKSEGELNTAIGNLLADIIREQTNPVFKVRTGKEIDMVLLNHGGIRASIGPGPVNARTAYQVMPFENQIVIAELTGEKVAEMLKYLESNRTAHPLSGIKIEVNDNYEVTSATIRGEPVDPEKTYFVATSDYLVQGGDNMNFFRDPVNLYGADYKIRNAIIDYFKTVDTIKATRDDRYIKTKRQ